MICGNDIRDGVVLVFVRRIMCLTLPWRDGRIAHKYIL